MVRFLLVVSSVLMQCSLLACVAQANVWPLFRVEEEESSTTATTMDASNAATTTTISDSHGRRFLDNEIPSSHQRTGSHERRKLKGEERELMERSLQAVSFAPSAKFRGRAGWPPVIPEFPRGKGLRNNNSSNRRKLKEDYRLIDRSLQGNVFSILPSLQGRFGGQFQPKKGGSSGGGRPSLRLGLGGRKLEGPEVTSIDDSNITPNFDFIVAGFPKCGTTTLLKAFEKHQETAMASTEQCAVANAQSDVVAMKNLNTTLQSLMTDVSSPSPTNDIDNMKFSFKCPSAIYTHKTIARVQKHSPDAKFVIGVRHPVLMLQSFYNYRVTEIYERELNEAIPSLEEAVLQEEPWKGVSLDATRYELFLMQLAKTTLTTSETGDLMGHPGYDLAIKPNNFEVFFYDVEQLDDEDDTRSAEFRERLSSFLGLTEPLAPFAHENINHFVGSAGFEETIDICTPRFDELRSHLLQQGAYTARWLIDEFIQSDDVVVANKDHLVAAIQRWGTDPCLKEDAAFITA